MRITALKAALAAVIATMDGTLQAAADDNNRELTAEEQTAYDAKAKEAETLQAQIKREEALLALRASAAAPVVVPGGTGTGTTVPAAAAEKLEPGIAFARIVYSMAACGMDQHAAAAHAETVWGTEAGQIVANMEQATNVKGGFLVNTAYSADFVDLLRPRVVVRQLGARSVPMPDGNLTIRRKTAGTSAGYVGERVPAPVTGLQVGQFNMSAKRLAALVPITNQLIRRSAFGVEAMVRDDLVESVSIKEDQQFLRGTGSSTAPAGLLSLISNSHIIAANAVVNLANVTSDLGKLRLRVFESNIPMTSCGWVMSYRTKLFLENLRDGNGNFAFPTVKDGTLYGYPIGVTTSVPDNLGEDGDESEIYFGDFAQFLIGDTMQVAIAASDTAAYDDGGTIRSSFSNDETVIRILTEHDTQIRYDTAFAVLEGVRWNP
jgi:HK97 family phage major capsid protein